jgi:Domain of unknown function (DU1801)
MTANPDAEAWFAALGDHPLKSAMQKVREIILQGDPRMSEMVQYGTVQFVYKSPLCSFVQVKDKQRVNLMFNAAGRLQGEFPHLEGKSVKYLRFSDEQQVEARAEELKGIVKAWIAYKDH